MKACICPISGMNVTRLIPAALAGFVFVFIYEFIVHGILLMDMYVQTASIWRTPQQMEGLFPVTLAVQVLFSVFTAALFAKTVSGHSLKSGLLFGFILGLVVGVVQAGAYVYIPMPGSLALSWFFVMLVECVGLGAIAGLIYRKG